MSTNIAPITEGMSIEQAGRMADRLTTRCRKKGVALPKDVVQKVLEEEGDALSAEQFELLCRRVERRASLVVRRVKVNRTRTPNETITATGRKEYLTTSVVKAMPRGEGDEVEVVFFKLGRYVSDADLEKEYELLGLIPADPYSLSAVNEDDPAFADKHPNCTHWKNSDDRWCYAAFYRWHDERRVYVYQRGSDWDGYWSFAGLRKK